MNAYNIRNVSRTWRLIGENDENVDDTQKLAFSSEHLYFLICIPVHVDDNDDITRFL